MTAMWEPRARSMLRILQRIGATRPRRPALRLLQPDAIRLSYLSATRWILTSPWDEQRAADDARRIGLRVLDFHRQQFGRLAEASLGVAIEAPIPDLLPRFVEDNVALLRSVRTRMQADPARLQDPDRRQEVALFNLRRITFDQVGKLYGAATEARSRALGITRYEWQTMHDNRVRPDHRDLDGRMESWDSPPVGGGTGPDERGHPGSGIECRCTAAPDFTELLP